MDKDHVIELIDERFRAVNGGLEFKILRDGVQEDGEWWYVPVVAMHHGKDVTHGDREFPREKTVGIFAEVEEDMEENHHLTVLLVPAVA